MDVFRLDCPIIGHLLTLLDENQIIEKHHKKYEQIEICKEFANYFVTLIKIKTDQYISVILVTYSFVYLIVAHQAILMTFLFVVVYFLKKQQV